MESWTISHYRILEKLGAGGMGEVYLAEDTKLGRKVALKLLGEEFTTNRERLNRFEQEACAASSLNHPNILTIYEVGEENDRHYMVTEYIDGMTLRQRLHGEPLATMDVLEIAIQIAGALDEAHAAGIVHRDIKPDNVMIRRNGYVKLLDFGLAKLTERTIDRSSLDAEASTRVLVHTDVGVVMGTSHYMSPEQTRGQVVDARTDVWSLGVVMYEMVAGRPPFAGETPTDVLVSITQKEPQPLARFTTNFPAEMEWIISRALRKERDERYQTAKELLTDLRRLKQRLEFEAELERSVSPEKLAAMTTISDHGSVRTETTSATKTAEESKAVSSAEYIVSEIRRRKRGVGVAAVAVALAVAAGAFLYFNRANALTDKDTILISDFVNTTGEQVFDGTLKQALAVELGQTPFLNIFPEERVRQTLRFMGRSPDVRVTRDIGIEICERQGIKALLIGSISSLGSHYVISLEALNAHTGDTIARNQEEAENKEQVLSALSKAARDLREKLGESLSMMNQYAVPIEQATTSSLEALKAYANGNELRAKGRAEESAPFYRRAIELDSNFAMAYARLAVYHGNNSELEVAQRYAEKAYELRDRVSEHERFYISEKYHSHVTGDLDKAIEVLRAWAKTYPNDFIPHNNLAINLGNIGLFEEALKEAQEAVRLDPKTISARSNVVDTFVRLNRIDEATQAFNELKQENPEAEIVHFMAYSFAFLRNDRPSMEKEIEWSKGKAYEADQTYLEALVAAQHGKVKRAADLTQKAADLFERQGRTESASQVLADMGGVQATVGFCREGQANVTKGLEMTRGRITLSSAGMVHAFCGDTNRSQALLDELAKLYKTDTVLVSMLLPSMQALMERTRGNTAQTIQLLEPLRRYDLSKVVGFRHNYERGLAYLEERKGNEAAKEFQTILDHRNRDLYSVLYPLAHLQLARAAVIRGDQAKARTSYQDFLALWKDADPDIPILLQAKKEYEELQ